MPEKKVFKPSDFKSLRALRKNIAELFHSLKRYRTLLYKTVALAVAGAVLKVIAPMIVKQLSDVIVMAEMNGTSVDLSKVTGYGIRLAVIYVVVMLLGLWQSVTAAKFSSAVTENYRSEINKKINRLPLGYFDSHSIGDVLSRMSNDVDTFGQGLNESLNSIVTGITMILGTVVMMFLSNQEIAIVVVLTMPVSVAIIVATVQFSQKYFTLQQRELGTINAQVEETFSCHTVVYSYNGQKLMQTRFDKINRELSDSIAKANFFSSVLHPVMSFMGNLSYVVICIVGGYIALNRTDVSFVTTIVVFITYMNIFNNQIGNAANISSVLQSNAAAYERVMEFLNQDEEQREEISLKHNKIKGNVEFRDVSFGYDPDKTIIHHLSFHVKAGQKVAIVGPTGAGKTTLVNLLMRFYEVSDGEILIDGRSIKTMSKQEVHNCFGMVLQDTWLFEGTIKENIRFGSKNRSDEEIKNACATAFIDRFIESLPKGYETVIDETANISQGQKQLLTIARAIVNDAPMMILDEATSFVDTRTEEQIQKAMDRISEGKTSFVIAHRLSTIKNADLILVLKDGDIVEQGKHEQLLKQGGFYAELYNSQFTVA